MFKISMLKFSHFHIFSCSKFISYFNVVYYMRACNSKPDVHNVHEFPPTSNACGPSSYLCKPACVFIVYHYPSHV